MADGYWEIGADGASAEVEIKGVRVASGVYLVLSATEDSKESVVTKIAVIK